MILLKHVELFVQQESQLLTKPFEEVLAQARQTASAAGYNGKSNQPISDSLRFI
jgi:hypothetical protein